MKAIEYINVKAIGIFRKEFPDYKRIIDAYTGNGWKYDGFVPAKQSFFGKLLEIDLVFEKDEADLKE